MNTRQSRRTLDLTTGPVTGKLLSFVFPILLSNLLQHLYNAADKMVVGQFSGKVALAAVGAASAPTSMILTLLSGLALGSNIVCANLRGARKHEDLHRTMHSSVILAFCIGLVLCLIGLICAEPLLLWMDTPENVLPQALLYMRIFLCGTPLSMVYNFGSGILRAHGDARRPMTILAFTGLINVSLNLIFVLFCGMDVDGVALATIIAQAVSALLVLRILFDPRDVYKLQFRKLGLNRHDTLKIIRIGFPCCVNGLVFSVSNVFIQSTVNSFGDTVLAGNVAASGIVDMIYQILFAFYSGCISFAGQCCGAKKYHRIDRLLTQSILCCLSMLVVINLISTIFPEAVLGLFNRDPEVIQAGIPKLQILGWGYMLYAVSEILLGCLRGMGRTSVPTMLNVLGICAPRLIWIFLIFPFLPRNIYMLYSCYPISYVISIIALGIYYVKSRKDLSRQGDEVFDEVRA